jgi:hypothetical protein
MPQNKDKFYVDAFRSEDADGIVNLFKAVYGEHYPIRLFYNPDEIIAANLNGRYYSIVARTYNDQIIGANHLFRSAPYQGLYEIGIGLVLKEYRESSAFKEMLSYIINDFVPKNPHIEETWGEAVCNHIISQKMMFSFEHIDTVIEVALMPAETYCEEKSSAGRVATVDGFRCFAPKRHSIFLPPVYETIIRSIYGRLDDSRDIFVAEGRLPMGKETIAESLVFDSAQVARLFVWEAGSDFIYRINEFEAKARNQKVAVFQVFVNLSESWIGEAVDILRNRGYFFGGILPRWFDSDGLMMQKVDCSPNFEGIDLLHESSKDLLSFIQDDWMKLAGQ